MTKKINRKLTTDAIRCGKRGSCKKKRKPIGYGKADKKKIITQKLHTLIRKQENKNKMEQNPKLFVV